MKSCIFVLNLPGTTRIQNYMEEFSLVTFSTLSSSTQLVKISVHIFLIQNKSWAWKISENCAYYFIILQKTDRMWVYGQV